MLAVVRNRRAYLIHNLLSVLIVVFTPPFLPTLFQSLRALRLLRLARLLQLAPVFKRAVTLRGLQYASVLASGPRGNRQRVVQARVLPGRLVGRRQ